MHASIVAGNDGYFALGRRVILTRLPSKWAQATACRFPTFVEFVDPRREMKRKAVVADRPQVALLIETSLASGRDIVLGIARYVREHGPWSIFHEPHSLGAPVPKWLDTWRGDGIIARLQTNKIADAVAATRLPAVDVLGVQSRATIPLVHVDDAAVGADGRRTFAGARVPAFWVLRP